MDHRQIDSLANRRTYGWMDRYYADLYIWVYIHIRLHKYKCCNWFLVKHVQTEVIICVCVSVEMNSQINMPCQGVIHIYTYIHVRICMSSYVCVCVINHVSICMLHPPEMLLTWDCRCISFNLVIWILFSDKFGYCTFLFLPNIYRYLYENGLIFFVIVGWMIVCKISIWTDAIEYLFNKISFIFSLSLSYFFAYAKGQGLLNSQRYLKLKWKSNSWQSKIIL